MAAGGVEKELRSGTGARGGSCRFFFSSNEDVRIDIVMLLKLLNGYGSLLELRPVPRRFIALGIFFLYQPRFQRGPLFLAPVSWQSPRLPGAKKSNQSRRFSLSSDISKLLNNFYGLFFKFL